jgi:hypothetical protein
MKPIVNFPSLFSPTLRYYCRRQGLWQMPLQQRQSLANTCYDVQIAWCDPIKSRLCQEGREVVSLTVLCCYSTSLATLLVSDGRMNQYQYVIHPLTSQATLHRISGSR